MERTDSGATGRGRQHGGATPLPVLDYHAPDEKGGAGPWRRRGALRSLLGAAGGLALVAAVAATGVVVGNGINAADDRLLFAVPMFATAAVAAATYPLHRRRGWSGFGLGVLAAAALVLLVSVASLLALSLV